MVSEEEKACINKILNGDLSSFTYLVDTYKNKVYGLALRITKNEEDAEEVAQDAFLKVYRALGNFKMESSFSTWLFRIVYNTALTKIRKKKIDSRPIDDEYEDLNYSETNDALKQFEATDQKMILEEAMRQLSTDEVTLIDLYYSYDKNMHEIANIVDLSHGNVRIKLSRARKKLHTYVTSVMKLEKKDI